MKATDVLKEYAAGRRDFRGENLRCQNFKGKDLSGADFSECDIRGTIFQKANLTQTKFIKARAGLQLHSQIFLLAGAMILVALSGFMSGWSGYYISCIFDGSTVEYKVSGWLTLASLAIFCITSYRKGLAGFARAVSVALAVAVVGALAWAVLFALALAWAVSVGGAGALVFTVTVAFAVGVPVAFAFAVAAALAVAVAGAGAGALTVVGAGAFTVPVAVAVAGAGAFTVAGFVAFAVAVALTLLGYIISHRTIKGDSRDAWLREFALTFASIGGTCFYGATITDADFTGSTLRNSDLRAKSLIRTRFQGVINRDLAKVGKTLLSQPDVRELLINPHKGYKKDYSQANLRGANLDNANLKEANLTQADVSEATLKMQIYGTVI